jgi:hypothetical protein
MIIKGKRIRALDRHFKAVTIGTPIVLGIRDIECLNAKLTTVGFSSELAEGESVLPPTNFGPVSMRNAEGYVIIHRDRPKETASRMAEWHWKEWRGRYDSRECSKLVEVPYKRFPRTKVLPASVELRIQATTAGKKLVTVPLLDFNPTNHERILHCVNLLLEIFGECLVMTEGLDAIVNAPIKRLNWDVLPPGRLPWAKLKPALQPVIQRQPQGNQCLIEDRLETINRFGPEFLAIGRAGFTGYVIFGFPTKKLFAMESIHHGNATYVFGDDWENLSQLTKAEILNNGLHTARIVHLPGWHKQVSKLLT